MPGSSGPWPLRDSPVSRPIAPAVLPWKPPQKLMNSHLPVADLASRRAASTASAPPEKSWMWVRPSGNRLLTRFRNLARFSVEKLPKVDFSSCSLSMAT